jgi:hypothetical protein
VRGNRGVREQGCVGAGEQGCVGAWEQWGNKVDGIRAIGLIEIVARYI